MSTKSHRDAVFPLGDIVTLANIVERVKFLHQMVHTTAWPLGKGETVMAGIDAQRLFLKQDAGDGPVVSAMVARPLGNLADGIWGNAQPPAKANAAVDPCQRPMKPSRTVLQSRALPANQLEPQRPQTNQALNPPNGRLVPGHDDTLVKSLRPARREMARRS